MNRLTLSLVVLIVNTTHSHSAAGRRPARILVALGATAILALAACGEDGDSSSSATEAAGTAAPAAEAPGTTAAPVTTAASAGGGYGYEQAAPTPTPAAPALAAASVATAETDLGTVLVDANGMTLYGFTDDTAGEPTCVDGCADAWPPALIEGEPEVGDLDASVFTVVENALGSQLKAGDWPLYTFSGDAAPGDTNGQGSGGKWFVVAADGSLIES